MKKLTLKCIDCGKEYEPDRVYECECNGLLDILLNLESLEVSRKLFDSRLGAKGIYSSGVWRFRELVHPLVEDKDIISRPEGNTNLYHHEKVSSYTGIDSITLKHEGENPSGSFKDRGISPGVSEAKRLGMSTVACASTGNTSASLAAYAALAGMKCVVFVPEGKIAFGKLSQAIAYGARVLKISGNFDDAMKLVRKSSKGLDMYLLNSVNPWRIEGQKSIMFELVQQLNWEPPDWVVIPAGNLGNTSAFGKAFDELQKLGLIENIPRLAAVQATGANPFYKTWKNKSKKLESMDNPETIASAIKIGNPISWKKALRALKITNGLVEQVTDQEIMDAKAIVDSSGIGCEPASAASVAGAKKLRDKGIIDKSDKVVCIITGNILKDPDATINYHLDKIKSLKPKFANKPVSTEASLGAVRKIIEGV